MPTHAGVGVGGVGPLDSGFDQAVGTVGGVEDLIGVVQTEGGEIHHEVVLVRAGELDLVDLAVSGQDRLGHLVERLLQRRGIALGEGSRMIALTT